MNCDEGRIEAFLRGELSAEDVRAFDEHLLGCESCWWAVQEARAGRQAVEQLRVTAPSGLADRVAAAIDSERRPHPHGTERGRRRGSPPAFDRGRSGAPRRFVAAAAALVAVVAGTLGWVLSHQPAGDPPQIAKVVAMDSSAGANSVALRSGEHFEFGGQSLTVRSYRIEGITTLVATSTRPFPTPASSHLVAGSSPTAWMATHGKLGMYGVNRAPGDGRSSMFLVAAMPVARLPQVAAQLHLI